MPGGASGVALKLNSPKIYVYEEIVEFKQDDLRRFSVIFACSINLSHSAKGKFGLTLARPALKWFLKVWIDLSNKFRLWVYGGTNCYVGLLSINACTNYCDTSLSMTYVCGATPAFKNTP